jgi:hypothetical protein
MVASERFETEAPISSGDVRVKMLDHPQAILR